MIIVSGRLLSDCHELAMVKFCLLLRPRSLMRRNGLVNQVEVLGLADTFVTV